MQRIIILKVGLEVSISESGINKSSVILNFVYNGEEITIKNDYDITNPVKLELVGLLVWLAKLNINNAQIDIYTKNKSVYNYIKNMDYEDKQIMQTYEAVRIKHNFIYNPIYDPYNPIFDGCKIYSEDLKLSRRYERKLISKLVDNLLGGD